ncbi:ankyrin repeat and zinc finger domain-containing protein [Colletotrichum phormii]|uniref:Ankyrin repeat and zinc finger domain-containing protein n=1 Tax=Colletotrichum phormii TaxID=359342 RepID=A0AAJ0ELQ8_9PEZI|nr:ankyrin repeat and zinc finger domain-containing protein [Colletotrichum phormii]KAK1655802.1 ankyrin repeat and zinc finger domain-containing protein [Colletotrichum phormii]
MASKNTSDLLKRPLYVYDLPQEVLTTLSLKPDASIPEQAPPSPPSKDTSSSDLVGSQACSLCGVTFPTAIDQRSHQKSDWHHYNLKQKLRSAKPVSENEFEKLIGDLDESLSGSDSEESEDEDGKESTLTALLKKQATLADKYASPTADYNDGDEDTIRRRGKGNPPLIWFSSPVLPSNTYFGLYRAILSPEEQRDETKLVEVVRKKQLDPIAAPKVSKDGAAPPPAAYKGPHFFLCMIGGGHFAAMVVALPPRQNKSSAGAMNREATVLAHKTFHRYTTRRKQGGSQSANDNSKGNAHSAGASIRRYNEQALVDDVRNLLQEWKGLLDTSELLFIRATGATNRRTLFGPYDGQILKHNDARIRGFPFSTRRATQNELMRSFIELTRLKVREINPEDEIKPKSETHTPAKTAAPKPTKPKLTEEEETALLHTSQIQAFIRRSKLPALLSYLKTNDVSPDFQFQPSDQNHHSPTPLHLASNQNAAPLVLGLITRGCASPLITNKDGKTAFELAGDRATRDAFRVARSELGEDKWNWETARVPAPLSKADAEKRDERDRTEKDEQETARRRAEEERLRVEGPKADGRKPKSGGLAAIASTKTAQEKRVEEARGLTPEMRMKLDRERRARAAEERLKRMQNSS